MHYPTKSAGNSVLLRKPLDQVVNYSARIKYGFLSPVLVQIIVLRRHVKLIKSISIYNNFKQLLLKEFDCWLSFIENDHSMTNISLYSYYWKSSKHL